MEFLYVARTSTGDDTKMTNKNRIALRAIRKRDKALGPVATRSEAVSALNDCHTLLTIIDELQIDELRTIRPVARAIS